MQEKLLALVKGVFLAGILLVAGFLSCLTAMRLAIRGNEVEVPDIAGRELDQGARILRLSGLRAKVGSHRYDDSVPKDHVVYQIPPPHSKLKRDSPVRLVVSLGAKKIAVPMLEGASLRAAQIVLLQRGLTPGLTSRIHSATEQNDRILAQDPPPKSGFARSAQVSMLVSSGQRIPEFLMPDLVGQPSEDVVDGFDQLGLRLGAVNLQIVPTTQKGTILKQFPPPGSKIAAGSSIDLDISR